MLLSANPLPCDAPQTTSSSTLRLAVGIATRGRPAVLWQTLAGLEEQSLQPVRTLVSYAHPDDVGEAHLRFPNVTFLQSEAGLTRQRNAILRELVDEDVIAFLDDDFLLQADYLETMQRVFATEPDVAVATGKLLADGINGPGLTPEEGRAILADARPAPSVAALRAVFNAYGCNMMLRMAPIRTHGLRFNEELPLYGWYEDVEFSRQLAQFGRIVQVSQALGVHLGVKSGRQSGIRLGYSQVANPVYLARRKSVPWTFALASMCSRSLKNLVFSVRPEPMIDRRGRLQGNLRAWAELISGTIHPMRVMGL